ncbi:hypothetical protein DL96DRAFT_1684849 [Flagelloscypha sp. PMI_526]|nr:hypothetical protein DL96DRAFT_1684849 [Flagelloscypha sp. PMI_526]
MPQLGSNFHQSRCKLCRSSQLVPIFAFVVFALASRRLCLTAECHQAHELECPYFLSLCLSRISYVVGPVSQEVPHLGPLTGRNRTLSCWL